MTAQKVEQFNEAKLVTQAQAGQVSAFATLITGCQDRLYNLAAQLVGPQDAAELVQETFLKALKAIHQFQKKARFYTWLVRIMINLANDQRARKRRETQHLAAQAHEILTHSQAARIINPDNPANVLETKETVEIVHQGLESLQPHLRQSLVLRELEQFSYRQIAEIMNVSEGTVKSRLFRAREALRTVLTPYMQRD